MIDYLNENSLPSKFFVGNTKKSKFLYFIVGVLILLILIVIGFNFNLKQQNTTISKNTSKQENNIKLAENVVSWMESKKDEKGIYYQSVGCDYSTKTCDQISKTGTSGHTSLPAVWAKYLVLDVGSDVVSKESLSDDLDKYWKIGLYENEFYNCKLMKQMVESKWLSSEDKQKAKNICIDGTYYPTSAIELQLIDNIYRYVVINRAESVNTLGLDGSIYYLSVFPSDLLAKYQLTNDKNNLELAKHYYDVVTMAYKNNPDYFKPSDICAMGVSALDFYNFNKDESYKKYAVDLLKESIVNLDDNNTYVNPKCGLFAKQLFEATGDERYKKSMSKIVDIYNLSQRDSKGLASYMVGDGVYFDNVNKIGEMSTKTMKENALMVYLLLNDVQ